MCSVGYLREFVHERLTAAAEEIFGVLKQIIVEYEEEIARQRRLLDIVWKPEIKLRRTELPQQYICQEEVLHSSLDQDDPEPPQVKEEQEELCISQEGEQLVLKQETDTFMLTATYEESDHSEDQTVDEDHDIITQNAAEKEPIVNISVKSSLVPEPNTDHQLLSHNCHEAESQDQTGGKRGDSGSTRDAEPEPKNRHLKSKSHSNKVFKIHLNTRRGKKSFTCDACGKDFKDKSKLDRHLRIHTGEKPYLCKTCGNRFSDLSILRRHVTIHTGERPYSCKICGKHFRLKSDMKVHLRTHTGEKPYDCSTCGKRYCRVTDLKKHARIHTNEKQWTFKTQESSVMT